MIPPAATRLWEVKELRSNIIQHLAGLFEGKKGPLVKLISVNKETFEDVAEVIYEMVGNIWKHVNWSETDHILDYLERRHCPFHRMTKYASCVRIHKIQRYTELKNVGQWKLCRLFPNLRVISFRIPLEGYKPITAWLLRGPHDPTFFRLGLNIESRVPRTFDIHSLYKDAVNSGTEDGRFLLEAVVVDMHVVLGTRTDTDHGWLCDSLEGVALPHLTHLDFGTDSVLIEDLKTILAIAPNLTFLGIDVLDADDNNPAVYTKDLLDHLAAVPKLRELHLGDEFGQRICPWVSFVDRLLKICPSLECLEFPGLFERKSLMDPWLFVDDQRVTRPTELSGKRERWNLRQLTIKSNADRRELLSSTALTYFFATAIPLHCQLVLDMSDTERLPDEIPEGMEGEALLAAVELAKEWYTKINEGRKKIRRDLECGGPKRKRRLGWSVLRDEGGPSGRYGGGRLEAGS